MFSGACLADVSVSLARDIASIAAAETVEAAALSADGAREGGRNRGRRRRRGANSSGAEASAAASAISQHDRAPSETGRVSYVLGGDAKPESPLSHMHAAAQPLVKEHTSSYSSAEMRVVELQLVHAKVPGLTTLLPELAAETLPTRELAPAFAPEPAPELPRALAPASTSLRKHKHWAEVAEAEDEAHSVPAKRPRREAEAQTIDMHDSIATAAPTTERTTVEGTSQPPQMFDAPCASSKTVWLSTAHARAPAGALVRELTIDEAYELVAWLKRRRG